MRLILTKAGLDNVRLNLIKGVCDSCRERGAWDEPGRTPMPSTALPGKFNDRVGCDFINVLQTGTQCVSQHCSLHSICRCHRNTR
eukprot:6144665-Pyramimonas_sp.AAC.2